MVSNEKIIVVAFVVLGLAIFCATFASQSGVNSKIYYLSNIVNRQNALYGVPNASSFTLIYILNQSPTPSVPAGYADIRYQRAFVNSTTGGVPQQYSTLTTPYMVDVRIFSTPNSALAYAGYSSFLFLSTNYTAAGKILNVSGLYENMTVVTSMPKTLQNNECITVLLQNGRYYGDVDTCGSSGYLNYSYSVVIAKHIYSLLNSS